MLDGIDGTGKSTQCELVAEALTAHGYSVVRSKEPTNGPWGRILRDSATTGRLPLDEELRLFIADRKEHLATVIEPALRAGKIVIIDRYYFSTAAYQGARGMDFADIIRQNEAFAPEPDLLVILDIDPQASHGRIHARGDQANEFEQLSYLGRVRAIFEQLGKPYLLRIDAAQAREVVRDLIVSNVLAGIRQRGKPEASTP